MPIMSADPGRTSTYDLRNLLVSSALSIGWAIFVLVFGVGMLWVSLLAFPNAMPPELGCSGGGYAQPPVWLVMEAVVWIVLALTVPFVAARGHRVLGLVVALTSAVVPAFVLIAILTSPMAVTSFKGFCF
jgi:hypothetical protein